jgi:hypothetical protein
MVQLLMHIECYYISKILSIIITSQQLLKTTTIEIHLTSYSFKTINCFLTILLFLCNSCNNYVVVWIHKQLSWIKRFNLLIKIAWLIPHNEILR